MSEPDVASLLSVSQAIQIIDQTPLMPRMERRKLLDARGCVAASDLVADRDYPPFDKSLMDGFAVRAEDVETVPVILRRVGTIAAGTKSDRLVQRGEAMAIMTGAPLPPGADAVIPVESTENLGEGQIRILAPGKASRFIARAGSDCRRGATVLTRGTRLQSPQIAVAASIGAAEIDVFAPPRVGVLATGNEIVPLDQPVIDSQIRNCNSPMLAALVRSLGYPCEDLGIVRDDPNAIRSAIEEAGQDVLLVSGGMSMGEFDFVPRVLENLGYHLRITKLRIKPGKPFVFAEKAGRFVFGLPGNPVSGFCCTLRLVSRLLARLSGAEPVEHWLSGALSEALPPNGPREFYQPARLRDGIVHPLQWKGSADVFTLSSANVLLVRPENEPAQAKGALLRVLEIPT